VTTLTPTRTPEQPERTPSRPRTRRMRVTTFEE
jgi:hypothetical protein